jgi:NAD(P)-dependent dehydrogenase (short-subunit alcohol dehydrogenase family)
MKLHDKVAVVTGGGRGIGRAICLGFADEGADLVVAADIESQVKDVAAEVQARHRNAVAYRFDVAKPDDVEALLNATLSAFGKVDVLVNCAGVVGKRAFVHDADDAEWRRVIEVNLFGTYSCIKRFLPAMMRQGEGRIINIASISGKQASPTNAAYSASKHAVIGLTRTVAAEMGMLGVPGITVNAICPGVVNTDMVMGPGGVVDELARVLQAPRDQVVQERILPMSIQRRLLDAEEIAAAAVYLASPAARGVTGQAINVCGGAVGY